jgi:hypothetical protein
MWPTEMINYQRRAAGSCAKVQQRFTFVLHISIGGGGGGAMESQKFLWLLLLFVVVVCVRR